MGQILKERTPGEDVEVRDPPEEHRTAGCHRGRLRSLLY